MRWSVRDLFHFFLQKTTIKSGSPLAAAGRHVVGTVLENILSWNWTTPTTRITPRGSADFSNLSSVGDDSVKFVFVPERKMKKASSLAVESVPVSSNLGSPVSPINGSICFWIRDQPAGDERAAAQP